MDSVSEFHVKAPQATASEGLAQGPYVVATAGLQPATLWTKGAKSANSSSFHCSTTYQLILVCSALASSSHISEVSFQLVPVELMIKIHRKRLLSIYACMCS